MQLKPKNEDKSQMLRVARRGGLNLAELVDKTQGG